MPIAISNDFLSPIEIVSCLGTRNSHNNARELLKSLLCVNDLLLSNSGSHALLLVFRALKKVSSKELIAVSSYNCPHIVIAAAMAGFKVLPLEVDPKMLAPIKPEENLLQQCAAVVLTNLYGLADDIDSWKKIIPNDCLIIDDACQSFLSRRGQSKIGTEPDTLGILSFGRGKPLSGVGGGAVIFNKSSRENSLSQQCQEIILNSHAKTTSTEKSFPLVLNALAFWTATRPFVFSLILKSPMDLGKPDCPEGISEAPLSEFNTAYISRQLLKSDAISNCLKRNAASWQKALSEFPLQQPYLNREQREIAPIRYPLIFHTKKECDDAQSNLRHAGIGATRGYRRLLQYWPELDKYLLKDQATPMAETVCPRILLLPNHSQLTDTDIAISSTAIRKAYQSP